MKKEFGTVAPYLFTKEDEIESLAIFPKYLIVKMNRPIKETIFMLIQKKYPKLKIGAVVKGCEERVLIQLSKRGLVNIENIDIIGIACDIKQAEECRCPRPTPSKLMFGERVEGYSEANDEAVKELAKKNLIERLEYWQYHFSKCIKCYGCRNACPMCFCKNCSMEMDLYTKIGILPPQFPMFHFIRHYHLADRCIECGLCEESCPMDIPLRTISKSLRIVIKELFDYEAGLNIKDEAPLLTTLEITPIKEFKQ